MKPRHKRLVAVAIGLAVLAVGAGLVLNAFRSNLVFFFSPTEVAEKKAPVDRSFRLGGLVESGSLKRLPDGLSVSFVVTDTVQRVPVTYKGILPDLFREGKGVVAQGRLEPGGTFRAQEVLAKHDENYMPPEADEALKRARAMHEKGVKDMAARRAAEGTGKAAAAGAVPPTVPTDKAKP